VYGVLWVNVGGCQGRLLSVKGCLWTAAARGYAMCVPGVTACFTTALQQLGADCWVLK
jgi:hypothetical protein